MQYPPSRTLIFAKILLRNFLKVEFCVRRKNLFRQQKTEYILWNIIRPLQTKLNSSTIFDVIFYNI